MAQFLIVCYGCFEFDGTTFLFIYLFFFIISVTGDKNSLLALCVYSAPYIQ